MRYNYEGHDKLGQPVKGFVDAENEAIAAQTIRQERGHYAREISLGEVRTLYENPAVGGVTLRDDDKGTAEAAEPHPEEKETSEERLVKEGNVETPQTSSGDPRTRTEVLRAGLEGISEVLRQVQEWKAAYRTSAENKTPLPQGVPAVGGKTWDCYDKHFESIAEHLFKEVARQALATPSPLPR
jgi:hypothetical protein